MNVSVSGFARAGGAVSVMQTAAMAKAVETDLNI
jgi:hypothetical protein